MRAGSSWACAVKLGHHLWTGEPGAEEHAGEGVHVKLCWLFMGQPGGVQYMLL